MNLYKNKLHDIEENNSFLNLEPLIKSEEEYSLPVVGKSISKINEIISKKDDDLILSTEEVTIINLHLKNISNALHTDIKPIKYNSTVVAEESLLSTLKDIINKIIDFFKKIINWFLDLISKFINWIKSIFEENKKNKKDEDVVKNTEKLLDELTTKILTLPEEARKSIINLRKKNIITSTELTAALKAILKNVNITDKDKKIEELVNLFNIKINENNIVNIFITLSKIDNKLIDKNKTLTSNALVEIDNFLKQGANINFIKKNLEIINKVFENGKKLLDTKEVNIENVIKYNNDVFNNKELKETYLTEYIRNENLLTTLRSATVTGLSINTYALKKLAQEKDKLVIKYSYTTHTGLELDDETFKNNSSFITTSTPIEVNDLSDIGIESIFAFFTDSLEKNMGKYPNTTKDIYKSILKELESTETILKDYNKELDKKYEQINKNENEINIENKKIFNLLHNIINIVMNKEKEYIFLLKKDVDKHIALNSYILALKEESTKKQINLINELNKILNKKKGD